MCIVLLQDDVSAVLEFSSTHTTNYMFDFIECITGTNMALHIIDNHILYYDMDACMSVMLGYSFFPCPSYLVVQWWWIIAMLLHPSNILLAGPNAHHFFKFLPWMI